MSDFDLFLKQKYPIYNTIDYEDISVPWRQVKKDVAEWQEAQAKEEKKRIEKVNHEYRHSLNYDEGQED